MFTSLLRSLPASPIGWKIPPTLTLLGPKRFPQRPKILRSKRVKKAIVIKQGTRKIRILINLNKPT